ncbi:MAG: adaptor protein MecA [Lachnospiraceae bacterium]|jgi:negative regulator of genetic competence, sporulation and motility|nr:adaptor protein MecA [Lachnospiraceae bacterium]MCI8987313.1 adaptor protein MecA [Lachnospiraceae bacterium]MCI9015208.1 adaptor protein MecA [Lachnospiraceae bacterium]MCI9255072.1 adaptor protein MecA [Lachnospiraceae bacterium]MDE6901710.1 adaptor protein MecA [Lachnospiraceae bacterium]
MKYKKINDATVQCIITAEDMLEYGLTLADIFERNEKGEGFLRDIIERAHDEIGYQINGENIAMQITPLKDKGLVVTFTDESPMGFKDILQHLKDVLQGVSDEVSRQEQEAAREQESVFDENRRMFVFASLYQVMQYTASIPNTLSVKSHLYKEGDVYYLVLEKNRLSYKTFNKISAQGVEFANLIAVSEERMQYLEEHGECLIADRAVSRLRRIYLA